MNSDFYNIGLKVGTDKIYHHGYHRFYSQYIKRNISKILEIGVEGGHSINLWLEYCPNAFVYGMDIKTEYNNGRINVIKGDQSKTDDLQKVLEKTGGNLDVILDDGSHIPEHQILTFNTLFPSVVPGGIYIIEDIETSYWKQIGLYGYQTNYGQHHPLNLINVFKNVLHLVNKEFINKTETEMVTKNLQIHENIIDSISTITFAQNCIIIKKKELYEYQYNNRKYRFYKHIE